MKKVTHGGAPFNLPTDIASAPSGEMFMTDGYGIARAYNSRPKGSIFSPGVEPSTAPGRFKPPHGVWIDRRGRVLVAVRADRPLVFLQDAPSQPCED